jgi:hypothetical protein
MPEIEVAQPLLAVLSVHLKQNHTGKSACATQTSAAAIALG